MVGYWFRAVPTKITHSYFLPFLPNGMGVGVGVGGEVFLNVKGGGGLDLKIISF